jgi:hypothetical protein
MSIKFYSHHMKIIACTSLICHYSLFVLIINFGTKQPMMRLVMVRSVVETLITKIMTLCIQLYTWTSHRIWHNYGAKVTKLD